MGKKEAKADNFYTSKNSSMKCFTQLKKIENKTSFELNKSYMLDLSAEIKREDEFCLFYSSSQYLSGGFCPASAGRLYTPRWRSTRRRIASGGRRNRKRPSAPAPIRTPPRTGISPAPAASEVMTIFMISKPIAAISVPRNRALRRGRWRGRRQKIQKKSR